MSEASPEHVTSIVELWGQLVGTHEELDTFYARGDDAGALFRSYVLRCMEGPDSMVLVCLEEGRVLGYAIAMIELHPPVLRRREYGFIDNLAVDSRERRRGAGTLLVEGVLEWLSRHGIARVELSVDERNAAGMAFWKNRGFKDFQKTLARDA